VTTNAVGRIDDRHQARHDVAMLATLLAMQTDMIVWGMALAGIVGAWRSRT
jgi:hypothetical protein